MAFAGIDGLPQHFFKALCQDPKCREGMGGFHIPCDGGIVVFTCPKCQGISVYLNEKFGIKSKFLGKADKRSNHLHQTPAIVK